MERPYSIVRFVFSEVETYSWKSTGDNGLAISFLREGGIVSLTKRKAVAEEKV